MTLIILAWSVALVAIACYGVVHVLCFRCFKPRDKFRFMHSLFFVLLPISFLFGVACHEHLATAGVLQQASPTSGRLNALLLYGFLFLTTLTFYAMVDHSVRIRVAIELHKAGRRPVPLEEIITLYEPGAAMRRRLEKLVFGGYLGRSGEGYVLAPKGRRLAAVALWCKRLLSIGLGGSIESDQSNRSVRRKQ